MTPVLACFCIAILNFSAVFIAYAVGRREGVKEMIDQFEKKMQIAIAADKFNPPKDKDDL